MSKPTPHQSFPPTTLSYFSNSFPFSLLFLIFYLLIFILTAICSGSMCLLETNTLNLLGSLYDWIYYSLCTWQKQIFFSSGISISSASVTLLFKSSMFLLFWSFCGGAGGRGVVLDGMEGGVFYSSALIVDCKYFPAFLSIITFCILKLCYLRIIHLYTHLYLHIYLYINWKLIILGLP